MMNNKRIARLLVQDHRRNFCVRSIDVIVPASWSGADVLNQAASLLPDKMTRGHDDPDLVQFFPLDDDEVSADWSFPAAKRGQLEMFSHG